MPRGDCNGYRHRISRSWLTCEDIPNLYGTSLVLPERRSIAPLITTYSLADKQPWKEGMYVTQPPGAHGRSMAGSTQPQSIPYRAAGAFCGSTQSRSWSR